MTAKLRARVTLQRRAPGQDAIGQPVDTWEDVRTCWADFLHGSGIQSAMAGTEISKARASVRVRYTEEVTPAMRLIAPNGAVYEVKAVLPDLAKRQFLDLVCEALQ